MICYSRYFFLVLLALILLGLFNGLVFLPVLLVMVGPPSQVEPFSNADCLPPATPEPSPPRFKLKPHKPKSSRSYEKKELRSSSSNKESCQKPRRHNSEVSLSTIAEETHSQDSTSSMSSLDQQQDPSSVHSSLNGGTSVFLEPHITVETTTVPANVRFSSFQILVTKVRKHIFTFFFSECKQRFFSLFLTVRPGHQSNCHSAVQDGGSHTT